MLTNFAYYKLSKETLKCKNLGSFKIQEWAKICYTNTYKKKFEWLY